jgi:hypothetical protein
MRSITTPTMISPMPAVFSSPPGSPRKTIPITAIVAVPTPDQIAYAVLTGTSFSAWLKNQKAEAYPSAVITDGTSRVNPSLYLSDVVAMTSDAIAMASMSQDTSHLLVG